MKKIHITSLGCPKNFVDTEVMLGLLEQDGRQVVEEPGDADILLVNTCGFIQAAVEESIEEILTLAGHKNDTNGTVKKLVVTGCLVQRYRKKLVEEIPEIDLLVGTEGIKDIAMLLRQLDADDTVDDTAPIHIPGPFLMDSHIPRKLATPSFRAWMKITEGCDNRCSYCMIPSIRGGLRSRTIEDLVKEGCALEQKGVRELTLIAQDLTAYGSERNGKPALVPLLEALLRHTGIAWLRLLYLYPSGIGDDLLELIAENSRIVPYLDIPFQHVGNDVLRRMNRRYTCENLVELIEKTRKYLPQIALRTTFLLGFPGETEADIIQLEEFLYAQRIDHVGVFAYANEEGSPSQSLKNQISAEEKQNRVEHILAVQSAISSDILKKYVGRVEPVLVEGLSKETDLLLEGRTRFQAPDIDGCVYINDGVAAPGDIVQVKISESQIYDLVGAII
jgi:ribosomal protein S12 methylthiotransferase